MSCTLETSGIVKCLLHLEMDKSVNIEVGLNHFRDSHPIRTMYFWILYYEFRLEVLNKLVLFFCQHFGWDRWSCSTRGISWICTKGTSMLICIKIRSMHLGTYNNYCCRLSGGVFNSKVNKWLYKLLISILIACCDYKYKVHIQDCSTRLLCCQICSHVQFHFVEKKSVTEARGDAMKVLQWNCYSDHQCVFPGNSWFDQSSKHSLAMFL